MTTELAVRKTDVARLGPPRALLITGGAGFIGANFVHYWRRTHPADVIVVLDALTYAGCRESLVPLEGSPGFHFVHGDIRDGRLLADLLERHQISTVVHFAAETHVDRSITGPAAFVETNVVGTHGVLMAARAYWEGLSAAVRAEFRVHLVSTDEVFGSLEPDAPAFNESSAYEPNSPYAASKAASDHLGRAYFRTYGLPVTTSHCSNNYGPYQFPEKLLPRLLVNALEGKPLPVYGDGLQIRDWLHVEDHCRGIDVIVSRAKPGARLLLGGGTEVENLSLVRTLCARLDQQFAIDPTLRSRFPDAPPATGGASADLISFVADRPGHDRRYAVDGAAANALGFLPECDLASGLDRTIAWYCAKESWWRPLLARR